MGNRIKKTCYKCLCKFRILYKGKCFNCRRKDLTIIGSFKGKLSETTERRHFLNRRRAIEKEISQELKEVKKRCAKRSVQTKSK